MSKEAVFDFASIMRYELKRAERYRIFLSLVVFNLGPVVDMSEIIAKDEQKRDQFVREIRRVIRSCIREIDFLSNSGRLKLGLLLPETSRQGAEAATRRITGTIAEFCNDFLIRSNDYLVPVEIASFPDASGARSINSYIEEFSPQI